MEAGATPFFYVWILPTVTEHVPEHGSGDFRCVAARHHPTFLELRLRWEGGLRETNIAAAEEQQKLGLVETEGGQIRECRMKASGAWTTPGGVPRESPPGGRHLKDGARYTNQGPIQGEGWWSLAGSVQPRNWGVRRGCKGKRGWIPQGLWEEA